MDQTISKLNEFLQSKQSIAVAVPKDANVDQMAAALSLHLSLASAGRQVIIASAESPLVELSHLVGIDKVKTSLGGQSGDLVVSFPYREGEIEKVSYTLEEGLLNIVVKAGEAGLNFDQKDVKYTRSTSGPQLLFVVGASRVSDLGKLFDPQNLKETTVVNIDNSTQNQGFGDMVLVSTRNSSVCELVANLILSLNLPMNTDISQNLLDGILSATNNFQNPNTSALALEMAGVLMKNGAQRESQVREMASTAFNRTNEQSSPVNQNQNQNLQGLYGEKQPPAVQSQKPIEPSSQPAQNAGPSVQSSQAANQDQTLNNPPQDWLTPKIYKGSTNF